MNVVVILVQRKPKQGLQRDGERIVDENSFVSALMLTEHNWQMNNCLQAGKVRTV